MKNLNQELLTEINNNLEEKAIKLIRAGANIDKDKIERSISLGLFKLVKFMFQTLGERDNHYEIDPMTVENKTSFLLGYRKPTPLILAIQYKMTDSAIEFIEEGSSANSIIYEFHKGDNKYRYNAFWYALDEKNYELVDIMLDQGNIKLSSSRVEDLIAKDAHPIQLIINIINKSINSGEWLGKLSLDLINDIFDYVTNNETLTTLAVSNFHALTEIKKEKLSYNKIKNLATDIDTETNSLNSQMQNEELDNLKDRFIVEDHLYYHHAPSNAKVII